MKANFKCMLQKVDEVSKNNQNFFYYIFPNILNISIRALWMLNESKFEMHVQIGDEFFEFSQNFHKMFCEVL